MPGSVAAMVSSTVVGGSTDMTCGYTKVIGEVIARKERYEIHDKSHSMNQNKNSRVSI